MNKDEIHTLATKLCGLQREDWDALVRGMAAILRKRRPESMPAAEQIDDYQGLYLIYDETGNDLLYVGETGNLKKRRQDLEHTVNHTFRRHLGNDLFAKVGREVKGSKSTFGDERERELSNVIGRLKAVFIPFGIGRTEIEEQIVSNERRNGSTSRLYNIRQRRKRKQGK